MKRSPIPPWLKTYVFRRDGDACRYCDADPENTPYVVLHLHHVIPHSRGGTDTGDNLAVACSECNMKIGTRIIEPPLAPRTERYKLMVAEEMAKLFAEHIKPLLPAPAPPPPTSVELAVPLALFPSTDDRGRPYAEMDYHPYSALFDEYYMPWRSRA